MCGVGEWWVESAGVCMGGLCVCGASEDLAAIVSVPALSDRVS